jgi:chromosome segregation ATPase
MPATTDSTTLTIAFALLGFLLGFLLAALFYRRQVKRQKAEVVAQMSAVQGTLSSRERDLEALREEQATRDNDVQVAQQEAMELNARLAALTAELEELYTGTVEMEDRMNAAEARVLSAEAEMEQDRADLNQWSSA